MKIKKLLSIIRNSVEQVNQAGGLTCAWHRAKVIYHREGVKGISGRILQLSVSWSDNYKEWINRYDTLSDNTRVVMKNALDQWTVRPMISVVLPVYNPDPVWFVEAIDSVQNQIYPDWELCIADDASTDRRIRKILESYSARDSRIKVVFREKNGHICAASNSSMSMVSGRYVAFLDHDDILSPDALYAVALAIQEYPEAGIIYSDEDKIGRDGKRFHPYFKPDWNYELMLSQNMISHLGVYRVDLISAVGGFRPGFEGSQDYDLALRIIERLQSHQIVHIPKVLYHWRSHGESTAGSLNAKPYALDAAGRVLEEHLARMSVSGVVERHPKLTHCYVRYRVEEPLPSVTLILAGRNTSKGHETSLRSIIAETDYKSKNLEILLVDCQAEGSDDCWQFRKPEHLWKVKQMTTGANGNTAAAINKAVQQARGDIIVLLQPGIIVENSIWLRELVNVLQQPGIGCVGARIWQTDPSEGLWHGGYILGLGGLVGHSHQFCPRRQPGYFRRAVFMQSISAVSGACLAVCKKTFDQVGGMDENLPSSFYDVDFCLRLKMMGLRNIWTPLAELVRPQLTFHHADTDPVEHVREASLIRSRWALWLENDPAYNPNLSLDASGGFKLACPPRPTGYNHINRIQSQATNN